MSGSLLTMAASRPHDVRRTGAMSEILDHAPRDALTRGEGVVVGGV